MHFAHFLCSAALLISSFPDSNSSFLHIFSALHDLVSFKQFKKHQKPPWRSVTLTLLHRCFSRFLNCTNGTKPRKASHIFSFVLLIYWWGNLIWSFFRFSWSFWCTFFPVPCFFCSTFLVKFGNNLVTLVNSMHLNVGSWLTLNEMFTIAFRGCFILQ